MKYLSTTVFLLLWLPGRAQRVVLPSGEYMDTTLVHPAACPATNYVRYYNVQGKYPRSSETLAREAQALLQQSSAAYAGSGYVTFRFVVDCAGHRLPRVQVWQTDEQYRRFHFRSELVEALYAYLQTLNEWQVGRLQGVAVNYVAYLTFKLKNGKVVAVVP